MPVQLFDNDDIIIGYPHCKALLDGLNFDVVHRSPAFKDNVNDPGRINRVFKEKFLKHHPAEAARLEINHTGKVQMRFYMIACALSEEFACRENRRYLLGPHYYHRCDEIQE